MSILRVVRIAALLLCVSATLPSPLSSQGTPKRSQVEATSDVSTVLRNVRTRFERVRDYTAELTADVSMPGVKAPRMRARVYFKQPDRVKVEADGFAMIPKDVVAFNPAALSDELFDAVLQGEEKVNGTRCLKVRLMAKSDTLRIQRLILLVDPANWTVVRMQSDPATGTPADVDIEYALVENTHLLPSRIVLRMGALDDDARNPMRKPGRNTMPSGPATVTVRYDGYRVNTGLKDDLFKESRP